MDWTRGHSWARISFFREIALVRNADDVFHQSESGGNFSRSRQQRDDPWHFSHSQPGLITGHMFATPNPYPSPVIDSSWRARTLGESPLFPPVLDLSRPTKSDSRLSALCFTPQYCFHQVSGRI